jgi:hypothetical protein
VRGLVTSGGWREVRRGRVVGRVLWDGSDSGGYEAIENNECEYDWLEGGNVNVDLTPNKLAVLKRVNSFALRKARERYTELC